MKTRKYLGLIIMLMLVVSMSSCSSDDDRVIIQPINVAEEPIADFLKTELPNNYHSWSFFVYIDPKYSRPFAIDENIFCVINSQEELMNIYLGDKELPEIDFDNYTLIIGQQIMPYPGFYITKKELVEGEDGLVFNLYVRNDGYDDENRNAKLQFLYYWEFYPKLPQDNISINVIKEFPNRGKKWGG